MVNRPDIDTIINEQDFSVLYRWSVIFTKSIKAVDGSRNKLDNTNNILVSNKVITADLPRFSFEEIEIGLSRHKGYQAGIRRYDPITLTFTENDLATIQNFIYVWTDNISGSTTGSRGKKSNYSFDVILSPLKGDNSESMRYTLKNAWILNHNIGRLDGSSNTLIQPELTLRYDYFKVEKISSLNKAISVSENLSGKIVRG